MISSRDNKQVVKNFFEALNQHKSDLLDKLLTSDFVWYGNNNQNRAAYRKDLDGVIAAFPDAKWIIEDLLGDGDKVAIRWTFHGTHQHAWQSVPATGKRIIYGGTSICRLVDGKIAQVWNNENLLSLYSQLGFQVNPPRRRKLW